MADTTEAGTVWVRFDEGLPPWDGSTDAFLIRRSRDELPQVARFAPGSRGQALQASFPPFEGGAQGMRGVYLDINLLYGGDWAWAPIPE